MYIKFFKNYLKKNDTHRESRKNFKKKLIKIQRKLIPVVLYITEKNTINRTMITLMLRINLIFKFRKILNRIIKFYYFS